MAYVCVWSVLCIYMCVRTYMHLRAVSIGRILLCEWALILLSYERRRALVGGDWARRERRLRGTKKSGTSSFSRADSPVRDEHEGGWEGNLGTNSSFKKLPSAHQYTWGIRPRRERLLLSLNVLLILLEVVGKMEQYFLSLARTSLVYTQGSQAKDGTLWKPQRFP